MVSALIRRIVEFCSRHAWLVFIVYLLLAIVSIFVTSKKLDITTDTTKMFSTKMPWKQRSDWMGKNFPNREGILVAIIEAKIPEERELSAEILVNQLNQDKKHFYFASSPENNPFLVKNGLMFLDPPVLDQTLNTIIRAQPFLSSLAADTSARGLFDTLGMVVEGIKENQVDLEQFKNELNGFAKTLEKASQRDFEPFSWEKSLSGELSSLAGRYQIVVAKPKMDLTSLQPSWEAVASLKKAISSISYVQRGDVKIHITGDAKINDEEFSTVMDGMVLGLFASFVLVAGWLFLAVKTWRIILPILYVLLIGLILTTGFASIAVGTLNLISVSFAILFVSIAVDFAIQFSVRFRGQDIQADDNTNKRQSTLLALSKTGYDTGHQIFTASVAAAAGFLAFTPTNFVGVKQLGLIAGTGMIIALICTLTLLPAMLTILQPKIVQAMAGFPRLKSLDNKFRHYRWYILAVYAVIAVIGIFFLVDQKVSFDADPFHTKDTHSEGMKALQLLMNDPNTNPYTADVMAKSPEEAKKLVDQIGQLSSVQNVIWLGSFVPEDQKIKIPMIRDAASVLLNTLSNTSIKSRPSASELRQSMQKMLDKVNSVQNILTPDSPLERICLALQKIVSMSDNDLMKINDDLVRFLGFQLHHLEIMLTPSAVSLTDVPKELANEYRTKDGLYRIEIYPKGTNLDNEQIATFVKQIRSVAPEAAGTSVDIIESANTVVHAFIIAAVMAIITLAIIIFIALRRILDMCLVLMPLILSGLMTIIVIVLIDQPLNFANIITLPLLLGVGVSFNIYFVMNWREGLSNPLSSPTARAVLFSALTTGTAFGSLAASAHPGTASMGLLLLISLGCTLVATLIFVPALLPKRDIDRE